MILVIEEEPLVEVLADDLQLRFAGDFRVLDERSAASGLDALEALAGGPDSVALVIAGEAVGGEDGGVEILARAKALHPSAKRVLLVGRDYTPSNPVVKAMITWNPLTYLICSCRDIVIYGRLYGPLAYAATAVFSFLFFMMAWRLFYVSEDRLIERMI